MSLATRWLILLGRVWRCRSRLAASTQARNDTPTHKAKAAALVVLLGLEIAATLLSFGAQVIAEYERIGTTSQDAAPRPLRT